MKVVLTLTIQKTIDAGSEVAYDDAKISAMAELEREGWSVSVEDEQDA